MPGHLAALVPGQGETKVAGNLEEHFCQGVVEVVGAVACGEVNEADVAAMSLDQRADGRAVVSADDEVPFRKTIDAPGGSISERLTAAREAGCG
jgi:hypothetical protein